MQEAKEGVGALEKGHEIIGNAEPQLLNDLSNKKRNVRERAIRALLGTFRNEEEVEDILQTLPLALVQDGQILRSIWYVETLGKSGKTIVWQVLQRVCERAFVEMERCMENGNESVFSQLVQGMEAFFKMSKEHQWYKDFAGLKLLMGQYEETKGDYAKAISIYDELINEGEPTWYFAAARAYEQLGDEKANLMMLDSGWRFMGDMRCLHKSVSVMCKLWMISEAREKHAELLRVSDSVAIPFLTFKWTIDSDSELEEFEILMANYVSMNVFYTIDSFRDLAVSGSSYIAREVFEEEKRIVHLSPHPEDWSEEDVKSIERRLWLMQTDILTLGNSRYIEPYLNDLRIFGIDGDESMKRLLIEYFSSKFSKEVRRYLADSIEIIEFADEDDEEDEEKMSEAEFLRTIFNPGDKKSPYPAGDEEDLENPWTLLEDIGFHAKRIGEFFSQPEFYTLQRDVIIPIILACVQNGGVDEALDTNEFVASEEDEKAFLAWLKTHVDYYATLLPDVRESYAEFIRGFDTKYGTFYRRHLQCLAVDQDVDTEKYPAILKENPEIALLFWMEKIIACQMHLVSEEIEEIIKKYRLDSLGITDALLFGTLLFGFSQEWSIKYLANYPNMLDEPQAIYVITEWLRNVPRPTARNEFLKMLHAIVRKDYRSDEWNVQGFFEHVKYAFENILVNPSVSDAIYVHLANANIGILRRKEKVRVLTSYGTPVEWFRVAADMGSVEWLLQAGDLYENDGDLQNAMECFELAFKRDSNQQSVSKVINCALVASRLDIAEKYIDYAVVQWYDVGWYILAYHLQKRELKNAMVQYAMIAQADSTIYDRPKWLIELLCDTMDEILEMQDPWDGTIDELKILASFAKADIQLDDGFDPELSLKHWETIESLFDSYESERVNRLIVSALSILEPKVEIDELSMWSSDMTLEYLQEHAKNAYYEFLAVHDGLKEEGNEEEAAKCFECMQTFCKRFIVLMSRIPDSEKYLEKQKGDIGWKYRLPLKEVEVYHDMPMMAQ